MIEWEDNKKTWEKNKNLASIKERVKQFNLDAEQRVKEKDPRARNQEIQRKRMLKMQNKGSFEKKNQIKEVVGLRRNKFDNEIMVRVSWHPESVPSVTPEIENEEETGSAEAIKNNESVDSHDEKELLVQKKNQIFQPADSYVPQNYMK